MQIKLKVLGGKHDGKVIPLSVPEFLIGRSDEAHLRPNSDLISRKHCVIRQRNGSVVVEDLGSRNGTYVNGTSIEGSVEANSGDTIRVGKLHFEILVDAARPAQKKPKVTDVADAIARTKTTAVSQDESLSDDSITDWLTAPDDSTKQSLVDTQQFRFDESSTKLFVRSDERKSTISKSSAGEDDEPKTERNSDDESKSGVSKRKKTKPGRLPEKPAPVAESSRGAADDVLRKFFNRR